MDGAIDGWVRARRRMDEAEGGGVVARHNAAREADAAESLARLSARRGDAPGPGSPTRLEWCRLQVLIGDALRLRRSGLTDERWGEVTRELQGLRRQSAALEVLILEGRMLAPGPAGPNEDDLLMASVP